MMTTTYLDLRDDQSKGATMMTTDKTAEALAHHFRLIIDNYEGDYLRRCDLVTDARGDDAPRAYLADALNQWALEMLFGPEGEGDDLNAMQRELLGTVVAHIDWYAMADDYLAED